VSPFPTIQAGRHRGAVIVVTGGASGIGRSCAERLLAESARIVVADVNGDAASAAAKELGDSDRVLAVAVDVRSSPQCETMVQAALDAFGKLTGLVNCAGVNQPPQMIVDLPPEEWRRVLDINLTGTLFAIQAVAPHLERGGAIVTLASGAARVARKGAAAYCVSKAGVLTLTKVAALELGPQGIRVNAIAPGFIDTEMNRAKLSPERRAAIERSAPLGRVGTPDEVAAVASFLLSEDSSYICGDLIAVDGGVAAPSRT
jgi:NAD(P)-dependent dehydrogenase (short-subunit alcohol dehydrogenase family)